MNMTLPSNKLMTSALLKYLPKVVINHYKEKYIELRRKSTGEHGLKQLLPDHQEINCVSMFIDVAEFTVLTSDLAVLPDGTAQLAAALNNAMTSIVTVINKSNGDIVKFAGDAILVVWPLNERKELPSCIHRVVAIAFNLVKNLEFNTFTILDPDEENFFDNQAQDGRSSSPYKIANVTKTLEIKIGISYGLARILYLGGVRDNIVKTRCEYLPIGPALNEAFIAEGYCRPSMVVVPKKVYELECIKEAFEMSEIFPKDKKGKMPPPSYSSKYPMFKKRKQSSKDRFRASSKQDPKKSSHHSKGPVVNLEDLDLNPTHYKIEKMKKGVSLPRFTQFFTPFDGVGKALWSYVPVAIVPYFSEIALELWLPEMRTVTTLFCTLNVKQLKVDKLYENSSLYSAAGFVRETKNKLQSVFKGIQETVFKYQGTVNKFLVDDKGCSVLVAFGLPPFAHVSDPDRSALCAFGILGYLVNLKVTAHIGITTGVVYCGAIGGNAGVGGQRIEYTMIGDPVNVAARLMVEAKKRQTGIIMDMNTKVLLREKVSTTYLDDVKLKGKGKYDAYKVITSEDDAFIADWELRRSLRIFTSSIFSTQMKLGLSEQHLMSAFTGANLQGKLNNLNIDEEFTSSTYFNKRLEVESSIHSCNTVEIEFYDGSRLKSLHLPFDKKALKKTDDIHNVKLQALKELQKQKWKELRNYAFETKNQIQPVVFKSTGTDSCGRASQDPQSMRLLKIATRYSLYWKLDDERLFEVNDAMSLARFKVNTSNLTFRILKTLTAHWKLQNNDHVFMKRRRLENSFRENCFSLVDRLHSIANDFYIPRRRRQNSSPSSKLKTVLLEASTGAGKTHAVSDLINSVLKTTSFEVLISGGDPFEDAQNTQPFVVIATVIRQLLELRANKANVNNRKLFKKQFVEDVLKNTSDTLRLATSKPQHPTQYARIINESLGRAREMFGSCNIPLEAKPEEKHNHIFDSKKLYLLDEIIGTEFSKGGNEGSTSVTFSGSLAASKALSAVIIKQNFALGEDFKSRKVDRINARLNNRVHQRMAEEKKMKANKLKKLYFQSELDEYDDKDLIIATFRPTENVEEEEDVLSQISQESFNGYEAENLDAFSGPLDLNGEDVSNDIAEEFIDEKSDVFSPIGLGDYKSSAKVEKLKCEEKETKQYLSDMKDVVKLIAAILAGLTSETVPLLIHIDNAHRADPFSLLVVQELTQWWSKANILLLLCTHKSFSADVGKSNIENYVVEAGKRMSVVTIEFNTDIVDLSDIVYDIGSSPNATFAANMTSTTVLLTQLEEISNTIRIDLVPDKKITKQIIEVAACNLGLFKPDNFCDPIGVDNELFKYLRDRAGGHFLYIQEALQMYLKHGLIKMDFSSKSLILTSTGTILFKKALSTSKQIKRYQQSPKRSKKTKAIVHKARTRSSLHLTKSKQQVTGINMEPYRIPVRSLSRLIPGTLNAAFSEYFDSLEVKEQLLLKCAALISRANKEVEKGLFTFQRIKEVCPFLQEFSKNEHIEKEVQDAFELLKTTQLISPVERRISGYLTTNSDTAKYKFRSEWYSDILINRLLPSQLERIQKRIEHLKKEAEIKFMLKVPESQQNFKGWLFVKKIGKHGFKKRFCVLEKAILFLYKEDPQKGLPKNNCHTKIVLSSNVAKISYYDGPPFRTRLFGSGDDSERSFLLKTEQFYEMRTNSALEHKEPTQWLFVAKKDSDAELWHTKIKVQIRLSKN